MQTNKFSKRAILQYQYCIVRVIVASACKGLFFRLRSVSMNYWNYRRVYTLFRLKVSTKIIPWVFCFFTKTWNTWRLLRFFPELASGIGGAWNRDMTHDILVSALMRFGDLYHQGKDWKKHASFQNVPGSSDLRNHLQVHESKMKTMSFVYKFELHYISQ